MTHSLQPTESELTLENPVTESSICIRKAKTSDVEKLGSLWTFQRQFHEQWDNLYMSSPDTRFLWQEHIYLALNQPNHCILVAEISPGKIIGYIHGSFYPWPFSPHNYYGSLNTIAIKKERQGQSVGSKLVHCLIDWFKTQHIDYISVHVDHRNLKALNLYRKVGFRDYQHRFMLKMNQVE